MYQKTKPSERIRLILQFLYNKRKSSPPTLEEIIEHLINHQDAPKEVSRRTVERALSIIKKDIGIHVQSKLINGKHVYLIDESNELPMIHEEDKADLGILLRLINTHEELSSVQWLKSRLIEDFGMTEDHFKNDDFFVIPKPLISKHDEILKLAMKIIHFAKSNTVIQFFYQGEKTSDEPKLRTVAPIQVRFYDGRYYLAGLSWRFGKDLYDTLVIYALDKISELLVSPAIKELEDNTEELDEFWTFNHSNEIKRIKLKCYFDNCIGVQKPQNESPKEILIKFTGWARAHVLNHPIHLSQKVIENKNELLVSLFVYDTNEFDYVLSKYKNEYTRLR